MLTPFTHLREQVPGGGAPTDLRRPSNAFGGIREPTGYAHRRQPPPPLPPVPSSDRMVREKLRAAMHEPVPGLVWPVQRYWPAMKMPETVANWIAPCSPPMSFSMLYGGMAAGPRFT